jgi:two-component system, LytTR family, response regulator
MRLRVLVVDDEPLAREGLKLLLGRQPQVESVSEARNGREAIASIREQKPDLVLVDVQMPRTDGFAVVHAIGAELMPPVIFVTAHDQYAIRAFEIAAIDYLLKPVTAERFALAFKRAIGRLRGMPHEENTRQVLAMLDDVANPPRQIERFAVRSGERTIFVPVDEVDRIEAFQNYVRLHAGSATHLLHVPMSTIEAVLDSHRFLRIH